MSARVFAAGSSQYIVTDLGNAGFAFGPGTIAAIVRPTTGGGTQCVVSVGSSNSAAYRLMFQLTGELRFVTDNNTPAAIGATAVVSASNNLVAITKATGNVAPRMHIVPLDGSTVVHETAANTMANSSVPTGQCTLGRDVGGTYFNGHMLLAGIWNVVLTDVQVENLARDLAAWFAPAQPRALWDLNTEDVTVPIADISGGGADENTRTGTTISVQNLPWTPMGPRFRVMQSAATGTPVTGSDTAAGSNSAVLQGQLSDADSGTGTDSATVSFRVADSDSGAGADAITAKLSSVEDSGTSAEVGLLGGGTPVTGTDSGVGTDSASVLYTPSAADSGTGSDSGVVTLTPSVTDTGTGSDTATLSKALLSSSDSGVGSQAATLSAQLSVANVGVGADVAIPPGAIGLAGVKTVNGVGAVGVKTVNGLPWSAVKSWAGIS